MEEKYVKLSINLSCNSEIPVGGKNFFPLKNSFHGFADVHNAETCNLAVSVCGAIPGTDVLNAPDIEAMLLNDVKERRIVIAGLVVFPLPLPPFSGAVDGGTPISIAVVIMFGSAAPLDSDFGEISIRNVKPQM